MISPNYAPNGYDFFGIFHFFFGTFGSIASNPQESGMRVAERLTAIRLKTLEKDTACGVVPGLYVTVRKLADGSFAKYFVLKDRKQKRSYTIGKFPDISLSEAFTKAAEWRDLILKGDDPSKQLLEASSPQKLTYENLMFQWVEFNNKRGRWNDDKKPRLGVWQGYFRNHIPDSLRQCPAAELTPEMFADALAEKWRTMTNTPEKILADTRNAIDWAIRQEIIPPMLNPARIHGGKLGDLLPLNRPETGHEPALPVQKMPAFFKMLMEYTLSSPAARCLAFAILTAARNSTAREATWSEIQKDDDGNWIHLIPRSRMKVKAEGLPFDRKTPLSSVAVRLLETMPRVKYEGQDYLFPSIFQRSLKPMSPEAFSRLLKRMHNRQRKIDGIGWVDPEQIHGATQTPRIVTLHGCARASFNTWAKDGKRFGHPFFPKDVRESCLDHRNESYQCAYDRDQAIGEMRDVFEAWGQFLTQEMDDFN